MTLFATQLSPNRTTLADPVSLLLIGNARAAVVRNLLLAEQPRAWRDTGWLSSAMWAFIDDDVYGGTRGWKRADADIELVYPPRRWSSIMTSRLHLRIFEGNAFHPLLGFWAVAGAHVEHFGVPAAHLVHDWVYASDYVAERLAAASGTAVAMQPGAIDGPYQGVHFDGSIRVVTVA